MGVVKTMCYCCLGILGLASSGASGGDGGNSFCFGLVADIQYGDCDANRARFYRNSLSKLEECITAFNEAEVAFTVNLGDSVDRSQNDLAPVLERFAKLRAPLYHITGNHDYKGLKNNETLYRQLGMPGEYYSVLRNGWRLIMLNTNEIASYSNCGGTWKEAELKQMEKIIALEKRNNGQTYNGGVSSKQLQWLDTQLREARDKGEQVLVFSHHPLYPPIGLTALNDKEILNILSSYPCVKAVISGHHHAGAYGEYRGISCITLEGMIETEKTTAYAVVKVTPEAISIKGQGRAKSRVIPLSSLGKKD